MKVHLDPLTVERHLRSTSPLGKPRKARYRNVWALLAVAAALTAGASASAQTYQLTLLETGGGYIRSVGINDAGQIAGTRFSIGFNSAVLWTDPIENPMPQVLGSLGGTATYSYEAAAINATGQIVGSGAFVGSVEVSDSHAILWSGGQVYDLGTALPSGRAQAWGINDAGLVVGQTFGLGTSGNSAVVWDSKLQTVTQLTSLGGGLGVDNSAGVAISNTGFVTGSSSSTPNPGYTPAVRWDLSDPSALPTNLNAFPGASFIHAWGLAVNDSGQVAGEGVTSDGRYLAALWRDDQTYVLSTPGTAFGYAYGINNAGQVVGNRWDNPKQSALLWNSATSEAIDLNSFLDAAAVSAGWHLSSAKDINNNGWIVGNADNSITSEGTAFLLTPVPEPQSYALMLAGLGALALAARRRTLGVGKQAPRRS